MLKCVQKIIILEQQEIAIFIVIHIKAEHTFVEMVKKPNNMVY
jgi:hypothetical protein